VSGQRRHGNQHVTLNRLKTVDSPIAMMLFISSLIILASTPSSSIDGNIATRSVVVPWSERNRSIGNVVWDAMDTFKVRFSSIHVMIVFSN
jgi:hypothetical protein